MVRPWITPVFMAVPVRIQIHVTSDFISVPVHVGIDAFIFKSSSYKSESELLSLKVSFQPEGFLR